MTKNLKDNIIKDLELDKLPANKREEILTVMTEALLKRIILVVLEKIPEGKKNEFDEISKTKDADKINKFLAAIVPNYEEVLTAEIDNFKKEMKESVKQLRV